MDGGGRYVWRMNLGGKRCIRKLGVEIVVGQVWGGDTYGILGRDSDACEARANGGGRMMFETVLDSGVDVVESGTAWRRTHVLQLKFWMGFIGKGCESKRGVLLARMEGGFFDDHLP